MLYLYFIYLDMENTLWANTVVASGTAIGVVVYTGPETRSMMNNLGKLRLNLAHTTFRTKLCQIMGFIIVGYRIMG